MMKKNKIMILGANPETIQLVKKANEIGYYTIVVDPNIDSPSKKYANKSFEIDGLDKTSLLNLAKQESVDAILVGVADILVNTYQFLCEELGLPCYTSSSIQEAFKNKYAFNKICNQFKILTIPSFNHNEAINFLSLENEYQNKILVKPVDNGGGIGMSVVSDPEDLNNAKKIALSKSPSKQILIERYMDCDDMAAYYNFQDGEVFLCATSDRVTSKKQPGLSPVCIGAIYPSKYQNDFIKKVHPKLKQLFKYLDIQNGVLNIQFFVKNKFYAYDPGFRIQGEGTHIPIQDANNFDNIEMLLRFAMSSSYGVDLKALNDVNLKNNQYVTVWILLNTGKIKSIKGLKRIKQLNGYVKLKQRLFEGDCVEDYMIGNEKQVLARIYLKGKTKNDIRNLVSQVTKLISVLDHEDNEMILDFLKAQDF